MLETGPAPKDKGSVQGEEGICCCTGEEGCWCWLFTGQGVDLDLGGSTDSEGEKEENPGGGAVRLSVQC